MNYSDKVENSGETGGHRRYGEGWPRGVPPPTGRDLHAEMLRLCARIGFSPPRS